MDVGSDEDMDSDEDEEEEEDEEPVPSKKVKHWILFINSFK